MGIEKKLRNLFGYFFFFSFSLLSNIKMKFVFLIGFFLSAQSIPNPKTQTGKEAQNSGPERELATHEATEPSEAAEDCLERANKQSKKMWEKDPEWFGGPTFEQWTNKMKTQYQSSCHQAYHEKRNAQ